MDWLSDPGLAAIEQAPPSALNLHRPAIESLLARGRACLGARDPFLGLDFDGDPTVALLRALGTVMAVGRFGAGGGSCRADVVDPVDVLHSSVGVQGESASVRSVVGVG